MDLKGKRMAILAELRRFGSGLCPHPRPGRRGVRDHRRFREQGAGQLGRRNGKLLGN
jgi:hypothetical protein